MTGRRAARPRRGSSTPPIRSAHWRGRVPHPRSRARLPRRQLARDAAAAHARAGGNDARATEWAGGLINGWDHWLDLPQRVGDLLAPLIGAGPGEVVVHDSVTVNVYQLVRAALDADRRSRRDRRSIPATSRPTATSWRGSPPPTGARCGAGFDDLDDVAVVLRSMVDYRTAEIVDIDAETARITDAGALVIWDLSHAAGVHPVGLHAAGAQLAVGCTYKFLNGGPGSPAFAYVARELIDQIDNPIRGWFSQHDQFAMDNAYRARATTSAGSCSAHRASSP